MKKTALNSIYTSERNLRFSALSKRKTVLVSKDFVIEVESEGDAYQVRFLNPASLEVELRFNVLWKHEELSYRTLQQLLSLPPRLMDEVLRIAERFGISVEEAYLSEIRGILLYAKQAIELHEKKQGGRRR